LKHRTTADLVDLMTRYFFEDFVPGWTRTLGTLQVTEADLLAFAREYDPQPFHTDPDAAKTTFVGGLIASGWHTCSLNMRLLAEGLLLETASLGAPGIEEVKWIQPVRPGDSLTSQASVLEARSSKSRPDLGLVHFTFEMRNQRGEPVMRQTNWVLIGRRDPAPAGTEARTGGGARPAPDGNAAALPTAPAPDAAVAYLDDLKPGMVQDIGAHTFGAEEIVRFAKAFDPQPFHVDAEAAKHSLFGALCASGWHTGSVWMKCLVEHRNRMTADAVRNGRPVAQMGPSPGFKNLKWAKPVYVGDTIRYASTILETRPSASRPGWGLAFHRNTGVNQHGEEVFSFEGAVFVQRRP
jgi:acyl dehydratase